MLKFFTEGIDFKLAQPMKTSKWLKNVSRLESHEIGNLNYVFCSDDYLLDINKQYLDHDYYTDIITFDNSEEEEKLEGDIFVSIERVKENAQDLNVVFEVELRRVLVHGLLHLIGFTDSEGESKKQMRAKEDECLLLF